MKKNTLIAVVLMMAAVMFFTSETYYKMMGKEDQYPANREEVQKEREKVSKNKGVEGVAGIEEDKEKNKEKGEADSVLTGMDTTQDGSDTAVDKNINIDIDTVWIETDELVCGISELGGKIISVRIKKYTINNKDMIEMIDRGREGILGISVDNKSYKNKKFEYEGNNNINVGSDKRIVLKNGDIRKVYRFRKKGYRIGYEIKGVYDKTLSISFDGGIRESEETTGRKQRYDQKEVHLFNGNEAEKISKNKNTVENRTGSYKWISLKSKYFMIAAVKNEIEESDVNIEFKRLSTDKDEKSEIYLTESMFTDTDVKGYIYCGPLAIEELKKNGDEIKRVMFSGYKWFFAADKWFPPLCEFVLGMMIKLKEIVKDYGVVILILTIFVRLVTYPLTKSSQKSMSKMKELQPKITKIKEKYKGNSVKMNEKIMELYKKEGVNPLGGAGGCLPIIIQMPIFISLLIVLRKSIELRGADTFLIPWVNDLSMPEALIPLPIDIPMYGAHIGLLPILSAVFMFFQQKKTITDPNQKMMIYFMPIFLMVIFNNFASGLVLYFTFSNGLGLLQQIITDKMEKK